MTRHPRFEGGMTAWGRENYHLEDGQVPCWCGIDRDHTIAEFLADPDAAVHLPARTSPEEPARSR
jgi:hypothetical protein